MLTGYLSTCHLNAQIKSGIRSSESDYFIGTAEQMFDRIVSDTSVLTQNGYRLADLDFDGSHYIDLSYVPTTYTKVTISFKQTAYQKFLFGCRTSGSSSDAFAFCAYSGQIYAQYGDSQAPESFTMQLDAPHTLTLSNSGAVIDGALVKSFAGASFSASELKMYVGSRNQNDVADNRMFIGKVYSMQIYEGNTLVRDLYPYTNGASDGMYDALTGTVYTMIQEGEG